MRAVEYFPLTNKKNYEIWLIECIFEDKMAPVSHGRLKQKLLKMFEIFNVFRISSQ